LVEVFCILWGVGGVFFVCFKDVDVVRHPLVGRIVRAYDAQYTQREESEQTA
jgi:phosphate starvation-inducible protein PhoH and related proteins